MSIIAYPLEATEYTAEDAQSYFSTRKSGVYSEDVTFTPEGMNITVSPFLAWFNYAKFKGCSVAVTEPQTLTFSPAHAILDRIDRVVLRLDLSLNRAYFEILEGTPSSTPIAKTISKTEVINDISPFYVRIKAGATQITPADITSTILDESLCGIMRDGVTGIPTSQLQSQVEELLLRLHEAIDGVEEGSAFMIGDIYDPEGKTKPVAFKDETLPIDGSVPITGEEFFISEGLGSVYADDWGTNIMNYAGNSPNDINKRGIAVRSSGSLPDVEDSVLLLNWVDGILTKYEIWGEHNKPSGIYTGNGSLSRSINLGGYGSLVYIYAEDLSAQGFALRNVGFCVKINSDDTVGLTSSDATFESGFLYFTSSKYSSLLNKSGKTYRYQVL